MDKKWYKRKGSSIKWSFKAKIMIIFATLLANISILLCNILCIKEDNNRAKEGIKLMKIYLNDMHFIKNNPCFMYYYEDVVVLQYETLES